MLKTESLPPEIKAINFMNYNKAFTKPAFRELIHRSFPRVELAVGYGSGVFQQANVSKHNMIDLLMVVKDRRLFHKENMQRNRVHYSGLSRLFGEAYVNLLNSYVFPIHFNAHLEVEGYTVKYGVMDQQTFVDDLEVWDYLSVAGRLHKPVKIMQYQQQNPYEMSMTTNLVRCLSVVLLMEMRKVLTQRELFMKITELSYLGDVRFWAGLESPKKVGNIVDGNFANFKRLYQPILQSHFRKNIALQGQNIYVDNSIQFRKKLLSQIPHTVKCKLVTSVEQLTNFSDNMMIRHPSQVKQELTQAITAINKRSSMKMALYSALSSSWIKNLRYKLEKYQKAKK